MEVRHIFPNGSSPGPLAGGAWPDPIFDELNILHHTWNGHGLL